MLGDWRTRFTDEALTLVSRLLMQRDRAFRVTRRLRRHPLMQEISFASRDRRLSSNFVPAALNFPVMLLCHGIGETVEHWSAVQALLRDHGIGSMVYNYSGYGRSTGRPCARYCDEDFQAAHVALRGLVGDEVPLFVLGFSLGTGIAAKGISQLQPQPAGLFLCEAFTSFADAVCAAGLPRWLVDRLVPEIWTTESNIRNVSIPVSMVHSDGDRLFPVAMAERIVAAHGSCHATAAELVVISGFAHNEPFLKPDERYWRPILDRVLGVKN